MNNNKICTTYILPSIHDLQGSINKHQIVVSVCLCVSQKYMYETQRPIYFPMQYVQYSSYTIRGRHKNVISMLECLSLNFNSYTLITQPTDIENILKFTALDISTISDQLN